MEDNKLYAYLWSLLAVVVVVVSSSAFYTNIHQSELPLRLIEQGISPAVARCTDVSWNITSNYVICKEVLANSRLTKKEATKLAEELK